MEEGGRPRTFQFTLRGLLVLAIGIGIGLSFGIGTLRFRPAPQAVSNEPKVPGWLPYVIEPPDVLTIQLASGNDPQFTPVSGEYLVAPDGTVSLGTFGRVRVAGKTIEKARCAIEQHLFGDLRSPKAAVKISSCDSKVYYVVVQDKRHDRIFRFPIAGKDEVLDALSQIPDLQDVSSKRVWIARPSDVLGEDRILDVNSKQNRRSPFNHQLLPGDRVYVFTR